MNLPIDTLTVRRFRGLVDVKLEQLSGINLFIGDNNSGKTSLLEAIAIYSDPLDSLAWRNVARRRVPGFLSISIVQGVSWLFPHDNRSLDPADFFSGEIAMRGHGQTGARNLRVVAQEFEEIFDRQTDGLTSADEEADSPGALLQRGIALNLELAHREGLFDEEAKRAIEFREPGLHQSRERRAASKEASLGFEIISPFDHGVEDLYMSRFRRAVIGEYKGQVIEALQRVDPGILDMEFLPSANSALGNRGAIYLRHARTGRTPLSAFGDGIRRVILMALTLFSARGGSLLIDEIESAIHTSVVGGVFRWLVDQCGKCNVQLFATTHSLEALDAILAAGELDLNNIAGYHLPSPDHAASPKRYDGAQLARLRFDRGLDVR